MRMGLHVEEGPRMQVSAAPVVTGGTEADAEVTADSDRPVQGRAVYSALEKKVDKSASLSNADILSIVRRK